MKHTSLHRKLILCKKNSKCEASRKVKKLYRELESSDKRHRNSVARRGLYNTISRNSSTEKHSKLSQIKSGRKDSSTGGNSRDVEQGSQCRNAKPLGRGIYQQSLSRREKIWENRPVINLKHLNQFIPYQHFKMESLHCR